MYKILINNDTKIVHATDPLYADTEELLTLCGHAGWLLWSKTVVGGQTKAQVMKSVTCKRCLRSLGAYTLQRKRKKQLPETPKLTVDAIIHVHDKIVMIERKNAPLGYAFPGGFVDVGESCEEAVVREAKEEVCLDCKVQGVLGVYSKPDRDKRGHIVSITYILTAPKGSIPRAADDAKEAFLTTPHEACKKVLIADHKQMLIDFYHQYWDKWSTIR